MIARTQRAAVYSTTLATAVVHSRQRHLVSEVVRLGRTLPDRLASPLPAAMSDLTPAPGNNTLSHDIIRQIVDATTAFGIGRPLGICLRRSLLRYHFLRRAGLPVKVHFGARRLGEGIGGHAWLTLHGEPYYENPDNYLRYIIMYSYPDETAARDASSRHAAMQQESSRAAEGSAPAGER